MESVSGEFKSYLAGNIPFDTQVLELQRTFAVQLWNFIERERERERGL